MTEPRGILELFGYDPDDPVPRDEDGQRVIPDKLLRDLGRAKFEPTPETPTSQAAMRRRELLETLTVRETEVLLMVAEGLRYAQIATRLFMGYDTVRSHMLHIRWKLGSSGTAAGAVAVAFRRGLIE